MKAIIITTIQMHITFAPDLWAERWKHSSLQLYIFTLNWCGCIVRLMIVFGCRLVCRFIFSGCSVFEILSRLEYQPLQLVGGRLNESPTF